MKLAPCPVTVPVLQVSGALSHSLLALAGELSVVAGCEGAVPLLGALLLPLEEAGAPALVLPAAADAAEEAPAEVAGVPLLLLLLLHADTDSAALSASTAPV